MHPSIPALKADLIAQYCERSAGYFATKHNVSLSVVYTHATRLGLTSNQAWESQKQAIIAEYADYVPIKRIAAKYGHFQGNVKRKLIEWGVDVRSQSEANRRYALDESVFERIDTHEKAYWLGFIYADGNIYLRPGDSKYVFQVCLGAVDRAHVEHLRAFMKAETPLYTDRGNARFMVNSIKVTDDLQRLGVTPCKSLTMTFPTREQVPNEFVSSFVLGYFDGDGTIGVSGRNWQFGVIGTDAFNTALQAELIRCAGLPLTKLSREKRSGQGRLCSVVYGGVINPTSRRGVKHNLPKLYTYLYQYSPIWLPRKRERFETYLNTRYPNGWQHLT